MGKEKQLPAAGGKAWVGDIVCVRGETKKILLLSFPCFFLEKKTSLLYIHIYIIKKKKTEPSQLESKEL